MDINTVLSATLEGYELAKAKLAKAETIIKGLQEDNEALKWKINELENPKKKTKKKGK